MNHSFTEDQRIETLMTCEFCEAPAGTPDPCPGWSADRKPNRSDQNWWLNRDLWKGGGKIYPAPPDPYVTIASLTRMLEAAQKALAEERADRKRLLDAERDSIRMTYNGMDVHELNEILDVAEQTSGLSGLAALRKLVAP